MGYNQSMTVKIYEKQSYLKELSTEVTACFYEGDSVYMQLKETIFFPEEGGQYSDTGYITAGEKTVHILKGELIGSATEGDTDIRYLVDGEIAAGTKVKCFLDWDKRFDRMQNHSGEHILSGLIHNLYGYNNIGFHLSDDEPVTLVCDGKLTQDQVKELEIKANEAVYANLLISDSYPSKEELGSIDYRSKIEIAGQVRLITIGDPGDPLDICACCAPHVEETGAIGLIKVIQTSYVKGGTQLSILCGRRALEYINHHLDTLKTLADSFSTHQDNVPALVNNLRSEVSGLKEKLGNLTEKSILEDAGKENFNGLVITEMELTPANMKNIFNSLLLMHEGYVGIFTGTDETGYMYYAGGKGLDARELGSRMKESLNARGGGSAEMIQGKTSASKQEITDFWKKEF
jgi:alanyl-tRNA synthetase